MLSHPELLGVFLAQTADDGERGQLRLRSKPVLDRSDVRVELRTACEPSSYQAAGVVGRGSRIADLNRLAERLRESDFVGC